MTYASMFNDGFNPGDLGAMKPPWNGPTVQAFPHLFPSPSGARALFWK